MVRLPRWKVYLTLLVCLWGVLTALPNLLSKETLAAWPSILPRKTINLGLDLQGGSHLLLDVDVNSVLAEHLLSITDTVRNTLREDAITYQNFLPQGDRITFEIPDSAAADKAAFRLQEELGRDIVLTRDLATGGFSVTLSDTFITDRKDYAMKQSMEIVRRRVDETGTREPIIQRQGASRILLQLPGLENPERIKELLGRTAKLTFHLVNTDAMGDNAVNKVVPLSAMRVPAANKDDLQDGAFDYVLDRRAIITGDMLVDASPSYDQNNQPVVSFRLDGRGAKRFADVTQHNIGKPFAIVLDNQVISAPVIQSAILGGSAIITGRFTAQEVNDLSLLLRAGALPAPLKVLEERTVGPGLGADSISKGKTGSLVAFALVSVFTLIIYGFFGIFAVIALTFNMILLLACLSLLQATLTLPGIAGIGLTIGVAVDANVLIFERIREEIANNRSPISAIDAGYSNAYSSILDSNVTSLIAALILYSFGSGPVRGFAVTLCLGILTSFFSAIFLTRLMMTTWLWRRKPTTIKI